MTRTKQRATAEFPFYGLHISEVLALPRGKHDTANFCVHADNTCTLMLLKGGHTPRPMRPK